MHNLLISGAFYGYPLLALGILLLYKVLSNRYRRRGAGGLQHFGNRPLYVALAILLLEWVSKLVALAMIIIGMMLVKFG